MSSAIAKFLFLFAFIVNCIIWSQSRYGQLPQARSVLGQSTLVKRISYELTTPPSLRALAGEPAEQCRPLAFPVALQCQHVKDDCPEPSTALSINYLSRYFCAELTLRPLVFIGLAAWLIFLFSTLGISASDFFTPNLATIAQLLGLDDNVAGVTFLAFGNGSPDLFSTFSAMRTNSGSLAIGELIGAASFIVSCVVGSMCIIKPFKVHRGPFLRDVSFFTLAIAFVLVILRDHHIHAWEAATLVGLYIVYVFVVVAGNWWERRQEKKRLGEAMARAEYQDETTPLNVPYRDDPTVSEQSSHTIVFPTRPRAMTSPSSLSPLTIPPYSSATTSRIPSSHSPNPRMPSFSLVGALEFREVVAALQQQAASPTLNIFETPTPYAGGHYHSRTPSRGRTPRNSLTIRDDELDGSVPLDERTRPRIVVSPNLTPERVAEVQEAQQENHIQNGDYFGSVHRTPVPSVYRTPASPTLSNAESTEEQLFVIPTRKQRIYSVAGSVLHTLFPTLHRFREQSILGRIACVFAAPAVLLLTLTLPVVVTPYESTQTSREKSYHGTDGRLVDFEEEGIERVLIAEEEAEENMHDLTFNKWLMATQCILGPLFCTKVLFNGTKQEIWLLIAALIAGFAAATLVALFAQDGKHPSLRMARCTMGFCVSIVWIMAIADEVVDVLQTFGHIFGLSDAIIGLTIFAVGNSLADLVANMSVAVFAPIMGFSACFGGPMLNILLGIGITGSYIIEQTGQPYPLKLTTTLLVSSLGLLGLLAATLIFVPLNGYFLSRRWGILLITSYLAIMTVNLVVELKS